MLPLPSALVDASLPATVFGVGAALWVVVTLALAPFALADRVRALLAVGPTGTPAANYLLATLVLAVGHAASMVALSLAFGPFRGAELLGWIVAVDVGYPVLALGAGAFVLARNRYWPPTGRGVDGRIVLAAAAAWYALVTTVVAGIVVVVAALFSLPGGY